MISDTTFSPPTEIASAHLFKNPLSAPGTILLSTSSKKTTHRSQPVII